MRRFFTWAILKGDTKQRGTVRLFKKDAWVPPDIAFNYFPAGDPGTDDDLNAMVVGVQYVQKKMDELKHAGIVKQTTFPKNVPIGDRQSIIDYVRNEAWGHHACGTCAIGTVLDKDFQVKGTKNLRIVDASAFPEIPGFFIVTSIYLIAEKAADVIHAASAGP